jgi:hypothetical protein
VQGGEITWWARWERFKTWAHPFLIICFNSQQSTNKYFILQDMYKCLLRVGHPVTSNKFPILKDALPLFHTSLTAKLLTSQTLGDNQSISNTQHIITGVLHFGLLSNIHKTLFLSTGDLLSKYIKTDKDIFRYHIRYMF